MDHHQLKMTYTMRLVTKLAVVMAIGLCLCCCPAAVNAAPVAVNQAYTIGEGGTLTIAAPGVLVGATDANGTAPAKAVLASTVENGTLQLAADGGFVYTPAANFHGTDSFAYQAEDATGLQSAPANVTITVTADANHPPTAANFNYTVTAGQTFAVTAPGLLAGATDPDNVGGLQVVTTPVTAPANGVLALAADGSFTYTPSVDYSGAVSFTFKIKDARGTLESAPANVAITVDPAPPAPASPSPSPSPSPPPPEPPTQYCNKTSLAGARDTRWFPAEKNFLMYTVVFHESITQRIETIAHKPIQTVSLGTFASFDSARCRWRIENGTSAPGCSLDAYGQPRRRASVNLQCIRSMTERAAVVAVSEPAMCEYEVTVQSPEVCPPTHAIESSLAGATARLGRLAATKGYYRNYTVVFHQSVVQETRMIQGDVLTNTASLGNFARFDSAGSRWRIENGTTSRDCSRDKYGQRRRRGWVYLQCNATMTERAALVAASEPATCEYELTVHSPEVC